MKGPSFRDILAEFLEEKMESGEPRAFGAAPPDSPLNQSEQKQFQAEPTPLLYWKNENLRQTPKGGYPQQASRKNLPPREEKPARPVAPERFYKREQLSRDGQDATHTLLALGAVELKNEISLALVKKAHRRLAKALHPDRIVQNLPEAEKRRRREQFLLLQAAYETLSAEVKALDAKSSGSACGSGSASGQGSPHQDAA